MDNMSGIEAAQSSALFPALFTLKGLAPNTISNLTMLVLLSYININSHATITSKLTALYLELYGNV